ncbi:MAG: hypothetical protein ACK4VO_11790 [Pseudobdellovibrio sp.]
MSASQRKFRNSPRKEITPLTLDSFSSLESLEKLAKYGEIIEASSSGILIKFKREDFIKKELRSNLNIDFIIGHKVYFTIHEMDLEISGTIARTKFVGKKGGFIIAVDYSKDAPEYWRECLMDLLPPQN